MLALVYYRNHREFLPLSLNSYSFLPSEILLLTPNISTQGLKFKHRLSGSDNNLMITIYVKYEPISTFFYFECKEVVQNG